MTEPASPQLTPSYSYFEEGLLRWDMVTKCVCPACDQPVRWEWDGYLYHGACTPRCNLRHFSPKLRE